MLLLLSLIFACLAGVGISLLLVRWVGASPVRTSDVKLGARRVLPALLWTVLLGAVAGLLIGTLVLFFGSVVGRSGSTGEGPTWHPGVDFWLAVHAAAPTGAVMAALVYLIWLRGLPLLLLHRVALLAFGVTLLGGLLGALLNPGAAFVLALLGFVTSSRYAAVPAWREPA